MYPILAASAVFLVGGLPSQGIRLDQSVERPLVYFAQRAPEAGGEDVLATLREQIFHRTLGLDAAKTGSASVPRGGAHKNEVDAEGAVLRSMQSLLSRLSHDSKASEMALVGLVPVGRTSQPLLVFHAALRASGVQAMREMLGAGKIADRSRRVHDRQVYTLRVGGAGAPQGVTTGRVEIALVGGDMLVSNDAATMTRLLDPKTSAGGFARDEQFQRLRKQVKVPAGSLLMYADWRAVESQLDRILGLNLARMLSSAGIDDPRHLMFVASPASRKSGQKRGIRSEIVLQHGRGPFGDSGSETAGTGVPAPGQGKRRRSFASDGWLDLLKPRRMRDLVARIPGAGVVSIAASIDLERVLPTHRGTRMRRLQARIFNSCNYLGIDIRRQVLRRLDSSTGLQMLLVAPEKATPAAAPWQLAWSLKAKSAHDAKELFDLFAKTLPRRDGAKLKGSNAHPELHITNLTRRFERPMILSRVHDALIVTSDLRALKEVRKRSLASRRSGTSRRRAGVLASRLQRLGIRRTDEVDGVFGIDLGHLLPESAPRRKGADRLHGLLGFHGGVFRLEKEFVRMQVFSQVEAP